MLLESLSQVELNNEQGVKWETKTTHLLLNFFIPSN